MKFKKLADLLNKKQKILVCVRYYLTGSETAYQFESNVLTVDKALADYAEYDVYSIGRDLGVVRIDLRFESQYKMLWRE